MQTTINEIRIGPYRLMAMSDGDLEIIKDGESFSSGRLAEEDMESTEFHVFEIIAERE